MEDRPKVGIGVIVLKDGKVLMGKRKGSHGEGFWCFPGGHLEFREKIEDCAARETAEETGVLIKNIRMGTFTNDIFEKDGKHYVTLFVISDYLSGEARAMEPEKCERWEWFSWNNMPSPLFLPIQNLLTQKFDPLK